MNNIPFSVLISLYAKENPVYLISCFESLKIQTILASEIILVLDGSIGSSLRAVVSEYQSKLPITVIPLMKNIGLGRALNIGLKHCKYDWVVRMDTDDICLPHRFAKQVSFIQTHPNIDVVGGQIMEFETVPQQNGEVKQVPLSHQEILCYAPIRNPFNHMTVAYRKSAVLAVGGYLHHLGMEDYNLWLRMIAAGYQVANLPDILVYARVGNGMHARRRGWRYVQSEWQLLQLKRELHIQPELSAWLYFFVRSIPRILPASWLSAIYGILRQKP